ncbi:MAG: hypothetical protein IT531_10400 [Burkholderiales bacterium]|nr:hypothetical protein [Burkholderiales bacterium]
MRSIAICAGGRAAGLMLATGVALASPLSVQDAVPESHGPARWQRASETDLLSADTRLDIAAEPGASSGSSSHALRSPGPHGGGVLSPALSWDARTYDLTSGGAGNALFDSLRNLVNVQPLSGDRGAGAMREGGVPPVNPTAEFDFGPESREWMQEAVKGVMSSVLQLDVDARGRTSFSVLGLGDFSVSLSGDRSQIALTAGDNVLLTAQRVGGAAAGYGGDYGASSYRWGGASAAAPQGGSPLQEAIELVTEVASHPLSMLVYCIIGGYILLWSLLSRQSGNPPQQHPEARQHFAPPAPGRRVRRHRHV